MDTKSLRARWFTRAVVSVALAVIATAGVIAMLPFICIAAYLMRMAILRHPRA